jgi:hypothetical protein
MGLLLTLQSNLKIATKLYQMNMLFTKIIRYIILLNIIIKSSGSFI